MIIIIMYNVCLIDRALDTLRLYYIYNYRSKVIMLNSKASDRGFPGLNFDITPFVYKVFRRTPPVTGPTDLSGFW